MSIMSTPTPVSELLKDVPHWEPQAKHLAIMAGNGGLPVHVVRNAQAQGYSVHVFCLGGWLVERQYKTFTPYVHPLNVGKFGAFLAHCHRYNISHVTFAGKVEKWVLFTQLQVDRLTLTLLKHIPRRNDDAMMRFLIELIEEMNMQIIPQVQFMETLFQPEGIQTPELPMSDDDWIDACFGFDLAKDMGRLDVGQTVVVHETMAIAIEAIEGTDKCLLRAGKLLRGKGGCVAKVAKPEQDSRFDVPAVGLKTLKRMSQLGLTLLVTEANCTLFLDDIDVMTRYASTHGIRMISASHEHLAPWREQLQARQYAAPPEEYQLKGG